MNSPKPHSHISRHHHHHISGLLITVILLSVVLLFLIKPSIDNHLLNRRFSEFGVTPHEILSEIEATQIRHSSLQANLTTKSALVLELRDETALLRERVLNLQNTIAQLESELVFSEKSFNAKVVQLNDSYNQRIREFEHSLEQDTLAATKALESFAALHSSAGRSICCRERVDNPAINSYNLVNNRIVCSSSGDYVVVC